MLFDVSFGYKDDAVGAFAATDVVGYEDDGGCIGCLHRKPDLMDYGVMDNAACDCTAEVSTQKYPINHQWIVFGFSAIQIKYFSADLHFLNKWI